MIDSFEMLRPQIERARTVERFGLHEAPYAVVTLHRPSNVDDRHTLGELVSALLEVARELPVVFAIHPRTRKRLEEFALLTLLTGCPRVHATEPLSYIEFMNLVLHCRLAVTDSGGVQEETTYLGIPCVTLRDNTERPITVTEGSNRLLSAEGLPAAAGAVLDGKWPNGRRPERWDGHTSARAVASLRRLLGIGAPANFSNPLSPGFGRAARHTE